jgi:hypothetical protein
MRMILAGALALIGFTANAGEMPIFDAHIHYSHDAWEVVSPKDAAAILRKAGLKRAMVSSSNDEGTQKLAAEAPDIVIPVLRPYRQRGDLTTWTRDPAIIAYVEERLARYRYAAIGEFHVYGADADLPNVRRVVQLADDRKMFLHLHGDAEAVDRVFAQNPGARILWAHSGFDRPERVREMLRRYKTLWCDLAFRSEHGSGGKVHPDWRAAFEEFPDRFMVGTDTFTPERWFYIVEHANWSRAWLNDLPPDLAERIGWRNGETLFGTMLGQ